MNMNFDSKDLIFTLNNATKEMIESTEFYVGQCCLAVVAEAKDLAPFDEGRLSASTDYEVVNDSKTIKGFIGTNIEYAPYVHEGTGIYARNGQGRKTPWVWNGSTKKWRGRHLTRGQKPKPYLETALNSKKSSIERLLSKI